MVDPIFMIFDNTLHVLCSDFVMENNMSSVFGYMD